MWKKKQPEVKEYVEVRGKVKRFGVMPFNYVFQGFRLMLEGSDIPYIINVCAVNDAGSFVELTTPGDEVSFKVEKGYVNGTDFRNHSLLG